MMAAQKTMTTLEAAQAFIAQGWSVISIRPHDKKPLGAWKEFQTRYATEEELQTWFSKTNNNIGIVAGALSNLTIVDCDSDEAILFFTEMTNQTGGSLNTYKVKTQKGCHFYYYFVDGSSNFQARKEWPEIDLRSEGGYVVAPPSIHPSGKSYEVLANVPLGVAPPWLFEKSALTGHTAFNEPHESDDLFAPCDRGGRNMGLTRLAGTLLVDLSFEKALRMCQVWNRTNPEPLPDDELVKTVRSVAKKEAKKTEEWPEPILLEVQSLPELPTDLFPSWMEQMVNAVAKSTETPRELAATLGLATLATACQRTFVVEPEPGYVEPLNIWGIAAMESGNRKTAVLMAMTAPLLDYERDQTNQLIPERTRIESERKTLEMRIQHLRTQAAKANSVDSVDVIKEIADLEASLPSVPTTPQLWVQDVTPEKLGQLMAEHEGVMALISDEGGIFETIAGRYNSGIPNLDLLLKSHTGSPVRIHRASREPIDMVCPVLTMGLSPQPDVIRGLVQKPGFRGRGLLARFLYTLPPSQLGYRSLKSSAIRLLVKECYRQALHRLLAIKPPQSEANLPERFKLKLSKDAHREWKEFSRVVEVDLREGNRFEHIHDWAGKLPGAAARVAGLLHCASHLNAHAWSTPIELTTMEKALTLMAVLAEHALRAFEVMAANPDLEKAKKILAWIQRKELKSFTQRDCHHELQGTFSRIEDLKPGLQVLVERYIIRQAHVTQNRPGPRSSVYDVHPQLKQEKSV